MIMMDSCTRRVEEEKRRVGNEKAMDQTQRLGTITIWATNLGDRGRQTRGEGEEKESRWRERDDLTL